MQIETAIVNALNSIDMPEYIILVLSDRDGVEPRAPYLLINIINTNNVGLPRKSISHKLGNEVETIFQVKDIQVSLTFHAQATDPTHDWVQHFETGLHSDLVDWAFTQQGLGLVSSNGIMYQSQPVSGKNYKRAIIDITLRAEISDTFKVNNINHINIDGYFSDDVISDVIIDMDLYN